MRPGVSDNFGAACAACPGPDFAAAEITALVAALRVFDFDHFSAEIAEDHGDGGPAMTWPQSMTVMPERGKLFF
jgi:hypothetical protein